MVANFNSSPMITVLISSLYIIYYKKSTRINIIRNHPSGVPLSPIISPEIDGQLSQSKSLRSL